mgnify:CR=1 FL=1
MVSSIILGALGAWQIVIIVLVIVLLFGSAKIPELMRNLGKGVGEFKKSTRQPDQDAAKKTSDEPSDDQKK